MVSLCAFPKVVNCRQITELPFLGKIFETIVKNRLIFLKEVMKWNLEYKKWPLHDPVEVSKSETSRGFWVKDYPKEYKKSCIPLSRLRVTLV